MYTKINRRFLTVLSFLLLGMICLSFTSLWIGEGREIPLKKLDQGHKLMIVAHPDDESIFGGDELSGGDYVVLCITNGDNPVRRQEFYNVMKMTHNTGIILSFPDKTNGKRDNWKGVKSQIKAQIKRAVTQKEWDKIVTHNPEGEYGHQHHMMVNQIVTDVCQESNQTNGLYYFEHYFRKSDLYLHPTPVLSEQAVSWKNEILKNYSSQKHVVDGLGHILPYEELIFWKDFQTASNQSA